MKHDPRHVRNVVRAMLIARAWPIDLADDVCGRVHVKLLEAKGPTNLRQAAHWCACNEIEDRAKAARCFSVDFAEDAPSTLPDVKAVLARGPSTGSVASFYRWRRKAMRAA